MNESQAIKTMFVVGLPRSGTTLLTYLLAGLPRTLTLSEPFLVHSVVPHWRLRRFFSRVKASAGLCFVSAPPKDADENELLIFLEDMARRNQYSSLIIKETYRVASNWDNVAFLDHMASRYPVAAIIRHPYDVTVSSLRAFHWCRGLAGRMLRLWAPRMPLFANDRELVEHVGHNWSCYARWCMFNGITTMRYEDLVSDPQAQLRIVCDGFGQPFDERILDNGHARTAFGGIGDPVVMRRPEAVNKRSLGRGHLLGRELRGIVAQACGETATEMGYMATGP